MTPLWVRAESRPNENRTGITPGGVAALIAQGFTVTVEDSPRRVPTTNAYARAGATIVPTESWPTARYGAIIFGLKELPDDGTPLRHRHVMFGHPSRASLRDRFCCAGAGMGAGGCMTWNT